MRKLTSLTKRIDQGIRNAEGLGDLGCGEHGLGWDFIPLAAIKHAACGFFADAVHRIGAEEVNTHFAAVMPAFDVCPAIRIAFICRVIIWAVVGIYPLPPLLEKERHASHLALIAQAASSVGVHGAGVGAALAAYDDQIDTRI